jgi:hypothetical protein
MVGESDSPYRKSVRGCPLPQSKRWERGCADWMSQREKEWRKGRILARFGKGVDPGTGSTGNQTLGQLYSNRASTTTHSLPLVPPPHRPQPHAMLTVRSPLSRNTSEIIHERPGRVLHGAAVACANSRNLLQLPWPVSAGDPGVVQSVPSSSASMQCSPACRIAWRPRKRRKEVQTKNLVPFLLDRRVPSYLLIGFYSSYPF